MGKQCQTLFSWAPKLLQMVTAAMKLKDAYSWKETYDQPAAATAKSLQSCLILCNPIDGSPPGSPVPGILQPRQQIKKQRHYFVSKGLSSQGYGFSSSYVWM